MPKTQLTQITDLHFGETPEFTLAGIRPLDSFKAVLDAVNDAGRGDDLLLLSGDLSGTSSAESYIMLNQLLQDYGKQALWLPGNHDNVELMKKHLVNYPPYPVWEMGDWGILTLDSSQSETPIGHIRDEELRLVEDRLDQLKSKSILVSMHHCPIALGSFNQLFRFAHDCVGRAGRKAAAHVWDDAEFAFVIAAFRNLQIAEVAWG